MKQTELRFMWWEGNTKLTSIELDCTIPLMVGDVMIHRYLGIDHHLVVEKRIYVPGINVLTIIFKPTY